MTTTATTATTRQASCCCGQLKVTCTGDPVRVSMCHCLACQQRTGSAFGIQARFPSEQVSVDGKATQFSRSGDSGGRATFHFCPTCGSTVYWTLDGLPGFTAIAIGAFADPKFPPPSVGVYKDRQHTWAEMPNLKVEYFD